MRAIAYIAIFALLASISLVSCKREAGETQVEVPPVPVVVENPTVGTITSWSRATGDLASPMESMLSFPNGGRIIELVAEEGDRVAAGDYLGKVDTSTIAAQQRAALSQVDALESQAGAADVGVQVAQNQVEQARAAFEQVEADYERYKSLRDEGVATQSEFEQVELRYESARLALQSAEDGVVAARAQADAARSGIQAARDQAGQIAEMIDDGTLRAPFSGFISSRLHDPGTVVGPGTPVYRLVTDENSSNDKLEARFRISETILPYIHEGMEIYLDVEACQDNIATPIASISPEVSTDSRTVEVVAYIDRSLTSCLPGMFGIVRIPLETVDNAVLLPEEAVLVIGELSYVFLADGDTAVRREVETGLRESGLVQIVSGVTETDEVIVIGNNFLKDGASIQRMQRDAADRPTGGTD